MAATTTPKQKRRKGTLEDFTGFRPEFTKLNEEQEAANPLPPGTIARIHGVAAKLNFINLNHRYYSREVAEAAIGAAQKALGRGRITGEVDHPDWEASLKSAAVKYTRLAVEDDPQDPKKPFLVYEGFVLDNPNGRQLKTLLEAGVDVGSSTRGWCPPGDREEGTPDGEAEKCTIIKKWVLEGIDHVLYPSNDYGRITTHEEEEDEPPMDETVESLERAHPALVKSIREAAEVKAKAEAKTEHDAAVAVLNTAHATALEAAKKEGTDAVTAAKTAGATQEAAAVAAARAEEQAKSATAITEAKTAQTAAEAKVTPLTEENTRLKTENQTFARDRRIREVCDKPEVADFSLMLRSQLEAFEGDLTDDVVASKTTETRQMFESMGKPKGVGKTKPKDKGKKEEDTKEGTGLSARLAGID